MIALSPEERGTLREWVRSHRTEQRFVFRARIVLMAAEGLQNKDIAASLERRLGTVSKWRRRLARNSRDVIA